jgi:hypothetical protein
LRYLYRLRIAIENLFLVAKPDVVEHDVASVTHECANKLKRCDFLPVSLQAQCDVVRGGKVHEWRHVLPLDVRLLVCLSFCEANGTNISRAC